jgi:hypothetical protein
VRHSKTITLMMAALPVGLLALMIGCTASNELGGTALPNAFPDTRITGQPPSLLEAGFVIRFFWTGSDPDGQVIGFQWKLSSNDVDGISVADTLTVDPATGDTINPWFFTDGTDSVFIVDADILGYPNDSDLDPAHQRAFQTHTFFIRAVDDKGGVDPTPAFLSFTATTILPRVLVDRPARLSGYRDAQQAPPTVTFGYTGEDPDFDLGVPTQVRYLFKQAWIANPPHYVTTKYEMDNRMDEMVSFADSSWSRWIPYPSTPEERLISFPNQRVRDAEGRLIFYLFAIQARDTAGAVSVDRTYARNVHNIFISESMTPLLTVFERYLGTAQATGLNTRITVDIAQGQLLEFAWAGNADRYAGVVESYRYGWDLTDPSDENDPNWAVLPGLSTQHRSSPPISFGTGTHTLTIQCKDNSNQLTRITYVLDVVPVPDVSAQRAVLLVDDVKDQTSNAWPAPDRVTPLDRDPFRDAFWEDILDGEGGVAGFNPVQDVFDLEDEILEYRDIVNYRSIMWTGRYAQQNFVWTTWKPTTAGVERFIWLASYQEGVGNLFMIGDRIMNQFIEEQAWMIPWIFDSNETTAEFGNSVYRVGFGTRELPDGTVVIAGRERYPYRTAGISVLDHLTPRYSVYGASGAGSTGGGARNSACVGLKGLVIDDNFKANYMPEGGVFSDTIFTDLLFDWADLRMGNSDSLKAWVWGTDEFYDANVSVRVTPWSPQSCGDQPCVDAMFRSYSRFDWVKDRHEGQGDEAWPYTIFESFDVLQTACGRHALDVVTGRSKTSGLTVGFISHKTEANKPSHKGDVYWGFDPYRFNREDIRNAIHWVFGEHFGLIMSR